MLLEQPPLLMPILEELDVDAFEHVPCAVAEAQVAAQPVARQAARQLARRHALVAADAELKGAADRLEDELRRAHPELFDARGRVKQRALERLLVERAGGNDILEGDALGALLAVEEPPRRPDAAEPVPDGSWPRASSLRVLCRPRAGVQPGV